GSRLGGAVHTEHIGDWLVENGPNSLQLNSADALAIIRELGLDAKKITANSAAKNRYVVRDGRLHAVPFSAPAMLASRLFSLSTKLRIVTELFTRRRQRTADIGLAVFVRDHFGQEFVDYALDPFISGI